LDATKKAALRAVKLFFLGLVLQGMMVWLLFWNWTKVHLKELVDVKCLNLLMRYAGGFFHGVRSLTFGVDLQQIRLMGILQVDIMACVFFMGYITTLTIYFSILSNNGTSPLP
jgi:heparan-alpha-glucosaminide N-acetyltransferase